MRFPVIYVEKTIVDSKRVEKLKRFSDHIVLIDHYSEVFDPKNQNFRLQKKKASLICAKKTQRFCHQVPKGYGIGLKENYYFSHLFNCPFDCRYCFLQGMFSSANYLFFVNYEDLFEEISKICREKKEMVSFFSGYDADSIALDGVTDFVSSSLDFCLREELCMMEYRTKAVNIDCFLKREPLTNVVIAYSLTPEVIQKEYEHKTPSLDARLDAIEKLLATGWQVGLRFDPMIFCENTKRVYCDFFYEVFKRCQKIHSVSLGSFRLPTALFKRMKKLYPKERLFHHPLETVGGQVSYKKQMQKELLSFCREMIEQYVSKERIFLCQEDV